MSGQVDCPKAAADEFLIEAAREDPYGYRGTVIQEKRYTRLCIGRIAVKLSRLLRR
jgi:hypothetical protein